MGGKTDRHFSTDMQFGNIALNPGPPCLNMSPFAFNLGFGNDIKGSTGTAAKGDKCNIGNRNGNSSGNHEDTTCGNYNHGYNISKE